MEVIVYEVLDPKNRGSEVKQIDRFCIESKTFGIAKSVIRAKLERQWRVRSVNPTEDGRVAAYVEKKPPSVKTNRKKPVVHTGVIGKGRSLIDRVRGKRGTKRRR